MHKISHAPPNPTFFFWFIDNLVITEKQSLAASVVLNHLLSGLLSAQILDLNHVTYK